MWDSIRGFYDQDRDKDITRFWLLIGASVVGLGIGAFVDSQTFCYLGQDEIVAEYLAIAVIGIPVFTLLWYFRTRDVRQQIQQNHFNNAIKNLAIEGFTRENFGVRSLINLSQITPEFNKLIAIVFDSRIKELESIDPGCFKGLYRKGLIIEMKNWLTCHKNNKKMSDLSNCVDKTITRLRWLIVAGIIGLVLGAWADIEFFGNLVSLETVAKYLATAVVGLPIFMLLWYFRTRDVRQQIQQNHFNNAIENLVIERFTKENFGVKSLIKLSTITPYFNKLITIAFESKKEELKSIGSEGGQDSYHRGLITEIKNWLTCYKNNKKVGDLIDCIDKKIVRLLWLIGAICIVLLLEVFVRFQFFYYLVQPATVAKYLAVAGVGILILWCFCTHNVRKNKKESDSIDYRDTTIGRIWLLILASILGISLAYIPTEFFYDYWGQNKIIAKYLATASVGIPIFMFLRNFRTRDVRQQIQQNHFNNAIENLATKNFTTINFGVRSLIRLSEITPYYNTLITRVFKSKIVELESIGSGGVQGSCRRELITEMQKRPQGYKKTKDPTYVERFFICLFLYVFLVFHFFVYVEFLYL